ncbi:aminotransferase class I/II-fold pyridoxal phosphate-dependent enzyme [Pontibacter diazotrophicus]|uniref:Aminotransferase class I/II-fold pyridoxal phosphate-dependent enzyme n=1 Tax=Pontibacter diazotrophicus TaxID=1400979 RepID=A0A3D8LIT1_9BACT|nr:aminotransferase class I/II-fold pyridoxal phosphate-dependent enzyme [Pontibacter diazotrophicus]RDV17164.1 aminotransferase class I/II-fold pyridoxal phosphate-dependent enzyme [Pontibacter diazotrophicus]
MKGRREFLKSSGLATIPLLLPVGLTPPAAFANYTGKEENINFYTDGALTSPLEYVKELQEIIEKNNDTQDTYAKGGAVTKLEQKFAEITGKEKAIYMPSGTMANNLALKVLSEGNTKIFVQEVSHLYRDEGDAAQSVHSKRLIPLAPGRASFSFEELKEAVSYLDKGEVFKSGIGAVSIENPVRRADGQVFPIEEIRRISSYCREHNIKLHLDGARLHLASAYTGIPIQEYASYFDTVYISLYKYLGSKGGAVLSGDAKVIDQMPHLIKIYGGNMYQNWPYAAMALDKITHIEDTLHKAKTKGEQLISLINQSPNMEISRVPNGSNVFNLKVSAPVNYEKLIAHLKDKERMQIRTPDSQGIIKFFINETVLKRSNDSIVNALNKAISSSLA